jgi:uncharacterized damage-inducible protein DinB
MTNAEFFKERFEAEQAAFRKVLAAIPSDQFAYRPHEGCTKAGDLAWQLANEQGDLVHLLETKQTEYVPSQCPGSIDEVLQKWDKATEEVRKKLAEADDAQWDEEAKFLVGGEVVWKDSLRNLMWGFLFDMVHHRGQLSSYLRPMGAKVPAIYGPSGDER